MLCAHADRSRIAMGSDQLTSLRPPFKWHTEGIVRLTRR